MFGRGKLTHDGVATVVSSSSERHSFVVKSQGLTKCNYDLVVDVQPDGAPPFRAETSQWFARMLSPRVGDQIRVRCNPETNKVKLAIADDPRYNEGMHDAMRRNTLEAQRQADLAAPPGTPPAGTTTRRPPNSSGGQGQGQGQGQRFNPVTGQVQRD